MAAAAPTKAAPQIDTNQQIAALVTQNAALTKSVSELATVSKTNADLLEKASKPRYRDGLTPGRLFNDGHAPGARDGESALTSRPYSYAKALGWVQKQVSDEDAKVEIGLHNKLQTIYKEAGYEKASPNSFLMPLSSDIMMRTIDNTVAKEVRAITKGVATDADEVRYYIKKFGIEKTLSWIDESIGAALVPPPQQMELIDLLRNNAALMLAGASEIGMPPNGRAIWPRQTAAAQGYWLGEGQAITPSDQATGDLILTAKKAAAFTKVNNELFKFGGINVEQFVKNDLSMVLALLFDKAGLEAVGSNFTPKGLIQYQNISSYTATVQQGANGNTMRPQDIVQMIAAVFGKNAKFTSWVMRPEMFGKIQSQRWDTINAGDQAGGFIWGLLRTADEDQGIERGASWHLGGYKMVQSTNVSNTRTKGSASNLSYILGGDFPDLKIAMSGVVELSMTTQGDTAFQNDQTWIKAINYCDIAPAHEASFIWADQLLMS
jgi:HK97 family phage major capsid protein